MNGELEFPVSSDVEQPDSGNVIGGAAHDGAFESRSLAGSRYRMERRSSYCAETAWVWQRARFLCAKPQ